MLPDLFMLAMLVSPGSFGTKIVPMHWLATSRE